MNLAFVSDEAALTARRVPEEGVAPMPRLPAAVIRSTSALVALPMGAIAMRKYEPATPEDHASSANASRATVLRATTPSKPPHVKKPSRSPEAIAAPSWLYIRMPAPAVGPLVNGLTIRRPCPPLVTPVAIRLTFVPVVP